MIETARKLRVLLIAPYYSKVTPGESWSTYRWVEGISQQCETTVLTTHHADWNPTLSPVQAVEVVNWPDLRLPRRLARLGHELKPGYVLFYLRARRWIRRRLRTGWQFDLVHQINPLALRYPSPAAGLGLPYVIGPLAGSLETPPGFAAEGADRQWFRKLRQLDRFRVRHDPLLRRTYAGAALVLGVAPYVREMLAPIGIRRFELMNETGVDTVAISPKSGPAQGQRLRLLFVGRIIRTKGILEAIRAVALASKEHNLQFDVVGDGDLLATCKEEAARLQVSDRVSFHGRIPREEVSRWYERAHVFLFPSFREPSGNVVFEAMSHGCPVIACAYGGPGYVVDESCGRCLVPTDAESFPRLLSIAIREMASENTIARLSMGSISRINSLANWSLKIPKLLAHYGDIVREMVPAP